MTALHKSFDDEIKNYAQLKLQANKTNDKTIVTLVTGLWNIGRSNLNVGWSRKYQDYLDNFSKLLEVDCNMIIFGDSELEQFVLSKRKHDNTQFVLRSTNWFKNNDYYDKIQKIRTNAAWYNQVGWLKDSTQAKLRNV